MSVRRLAAPVTACLFLAITGALRADTDTLSIARRRLETTPGCGNDVAVAGAASVNKDAHKVYLGDWVIVSVCHLDTLLKESETQQTPITLFVEGKDTGNESQGIDVESNTLTFALDRNEKNANLWRPFLYDPLFDSEVKLRISVGLRGERAVPRVPGANLTLRLDKLYIDWWTRIWLAVLALVIVVILYCVVKTDMLRERSGTEGARGPYSLGRTQMAWWFFLIILSFNYIWLITADRDSIPPSLLGLMGISAATALAAAAIARGDHEPRESHGWWKDLVTDDRGVIALDRLQIVVWTIILGGVFLTSVIWELTMPEFNATLLALMGISSGTYIGFKLPQAQNEK
jgi:hypothetical protein